MPLDLIPLSESTETLTVLAEEGFTSALPAMYPSLVSFPSVAATFPSEGTPRTGLWFEDNTEDTQTLTPLTED